jgi:predicted DNA-binding transcriptional regulator AlpA
MSANVWRVALAIDLAMLQGGVMPDREPPDVVGTADAAKLIGVHRATIIRWANEGTLPIAVRLRNDAALYWRTDVERIAADRIPRKPHTAA